MIWSQEDTLGTSAPWPLGTVSRLEPWWAWGLGVVQGLGRSAEDPSLSCQGPCSPRSVGWRRDTRWEDSDVEKAPSEHSRVGWGREGTPKRASSTKGRQGGRPHTPRGPCSLQRPHPRSRKGVFGDPDPRLTAGAVALTCVSSPRAWSPIHRSISCWDWTPPLALCRAHGLSSPAALWLGQAGWRWRESHPPGPGSLGLIAPAAH